MNNSPFPASLLNPTPARRQWNKPRNARPSLLLESLETRAFLSAATLTATAPPADAPPAVSVPAKPAPKPVPTTTTSKVETYLVITMTDCTIS